MKGLILRLVGQDLLDGAPSVQRDKGRHRPSSIDRGIIGAAAVFLGFMLVVIGGHSSATAQGTQTTKPAATDVAFDPASPQSGDPLKVRMKLRHAVRAEVKWSVNGEEAGMSDYDGFADGVDFTGSLKAGDKIVARITPFNDMSEAGPVVEKEVTCTKAPPTLKLVSQKIEGKVYKAKVDVGDQDKDSVTLSVEGPTGMQIDKEGNITWDVGTTKSGRWPIKVVAKDTKGGESVLTWTVGITLPK